MESRSQSGSPQTPGRVRNWWGWGFEDARIDPAALAPAVEGLLGLPLQELEDPVALEDVVLPASRLGTPFSHEALDRVHHSLGKSYLDTIRAFRGQLDHVVDAVAHPADEAAVEAVLAWCADHDCAVIPYGGGTSVVGGVEPAQIPARFAGVVSLDLGGLDRVLEVDPVSRAARIQAGASGPGLEAQLREHDATLRFFPQSFECATLGGWIATRAGGHFATGPTHIDDLVESVRAVTPAAGTWGSRRLPGSGAGPSPDRMLLGSEGTLGVITEAWVRVQPRPEHRAGRAVRFPGGFLAGAQALRALAQSGLQPANCRLLDPLEARQNGAGDGTAAVLVLGFESTDAPVEDWLARALELCRLHGGGVPDEPAARGAGAGASDTWRAAFLAMPYLRDALLRLGLLSDTFESAITWDALEGFHTTVLGAAREALGEPCRVSVRVTHAYSDGCAPYVTVIAPARRGSEVEQWWAMKSAVSDALLAAGATITHHHAVGRDHRPWYERQRPDPFAAALAGAKAAVDPQGMLNPGVLLPAA